MQGGCVSTENEWFPSTDTHAKSDQGLVDIGGNLDSTKDDAQVEVCGYYTNNISHCTCGRHPTNVPLSN